MCDVPKPTKKWRKIKDTVKMGKAHRRSLGGTVASMDLFMSMLTYATPEANKSAPVLYV
jgi:hypothetical protein